MSLSFYLQQCVVLCCCHSKQIYGVCRVKSEQRIYNITRYENTRQIKMLLQQGIGTKQNKTTQKLEIFEAETTKTFKIVYGLMYFNSMYKLIKDLTLLWMKKKTKYLWFGAQLNISINATIKKMAPNRVAPVWASPSWADRAEPMMFSFGASNFYRLPRAMYQPLWPYQCQYQLLCAFILSGGGVFLSTP